MKRQNFILVSLFLIFLASCKKDGSVSFGTVEYYPSFLWEEENSTPLTKTFDFEFSEDAKKDPACFAEFQFVDKDGNPIGTDVMQVTIDGEQLKNNKFRIKSDLKSKEISFMFSPNAEEGKYQGNLKLIGHNLERLNEQPLKPNQQVNAFNWTLNYKESMNPLAKVLMWMGIAIIALLAIWFVCLKPIFYPRFGSIQKTFNVPGMAPLIVKFKGARMVEVAASHQNKQSKWNRFWTGRILYKTHPAFVSPIIFKPSKGHRILTKFQTGTYQITPNPMPGIGSATIIDINNNLKVNIN